MNLYDFDKTIYLHDSSVRFYLHCLKRKPSISFRLPYQFIAFALWKLKIKDKVYFKEAFFSFLKQIKDVEQEVSCFWDKEEANICRWFTAQKSEDDTVASASPEFLIEPICHRLGIKCIATQVDPKTGKFLSPNCYGMEKPVRLNAIGITEADKAYSDSKSDLPMLSMAKEGYIVKNKSVHESIITRQDQVK